MKLSLICLLGTAFLAALLFPSGSGGPADEGEIRKLEIRLPAAGGAERWDLLARLAGLLRNDNPKKAFKYASEALSMPAPSASPPAAGRRRAELLVLACQAGLEAVRTGEVKGYAEQLLTYARGEGRESYRAAGLQSLGMVHYYRGKNETAGSYYHRALEIYRSINDSLGIGRTLRLTGDLNRRLGRFSRAQECLLEAVQRFEALGEKRRLGSAQNSLGLLYWELDELPRALEYYREALRNYREVGWELGISIALTNAGNIYRRQGDMDKALECGEQSLKIAYKMGVPARISAYLNNLGDLHQTNGDLSRALSYYSRALKLAESSKSLDLQAIILLGIGTVYRERGQNRKAVHYLLRGVDIGRANVNRGILAQVYQNASAAYKALGDYASALHFYKAYKKIEDAAYDRKSRDKIAELQTRHEMEKKKKQIKLLKRDEMLNRIDLRGQKLITYHVLGASVFVLLVTLFIFARYRLKSRLSLALRQEIVMHRQTARKLKESREKFKALAENAAVGIFILQDNAIQYVNPRFLDTYGYREEDVLGHSPLEFAWDEDKPGVDEAIRAKMSGESDVVYRRIRTLSPGGEPVYCDYYSARFMFRGKPAILGTMVDVTERKKLEAELWASKKLEAFGLFAGGIAHDFNNLLGVMLGYLGMAAEDLREADPHDRSGTGARLETAETAVRKAAELARKLIAFTRDGAPGPKNLDAETLLKDLLKEHPGVSPFQGIQSPGPGFPLP